MNSSSVVQIISDVLTAAGEFKEGANVGPRNARGTWRWPGMRPRPRSRKRRRGTFGPFVPGYRFVNTSGGGLTVNKRKRKRRRKRGRGRAVLTRLRRLERMNRRKANPWIKKKILQTENQYSLENAVTYDVYSVNQNSLVETYINDEFTDAAGTVIDMTAANKNRKVRFAPTRISFRWRNNYQLPCYLYYWLLKPKKPTSVNPEDNITGDIQNYGLPGAGKEDSPSWWPHDSEMFRRWWKSLTFKKVLLNPGEEHQFNFTAPAFTYSADDYDTHSQNYRWYSRVLMTRVQGTIAHDSAANQLSSGISVGLAPSALDLHVYRTIKMRAVDATFQKIYTQSNGLDTFLNQPELEIDHDPATEAGP